MKIRVALSVPSRPDCAGSRECRFFGVMDDENGRLRSHCGLFDRWLAGDDWRTAVPCRECLAARKEGDR